MSNIIVTSSTSSHGSDHRIERPTVSVEQEIWCLKLLSQSFQLVLQTTFCEGDGLGNPDPSDE